jgi:hypothetical protein
MLKALRLTLAACLGALCAPVLVAVIVETIKYKKGKV